MPQKSSVAMIDESVKGELDQMIRDGRATIDEMKDYLDQKLGEEAPSRSAVGRYKHNMVESMKVFQATQEMAGVWAKKMEEQPDSPIAQLAQQVLGSVALHTANEMMNSGKAIPADKLMFAAKALDHLSRAEKTTTDRELKIREKIIKEAADVVEETAKAQGMDEDQAKFWREQVLGIK